MVCILNYGFGNIASISNMLTKIGAENKIISSAEEIDHAESIILPGIGKFDHAINQIKLLGLMDSLNLAANVRKIPMLGICLGMQLMTNGSQEGNLPGFGWINAETNKIPDTNKVRVPHMGWNLIEVKKESPFFSHDDLDEHKYYFVHSYAVQCNNQEDIISTTFYGDEFVSSFVRGNIVGVQFHPEKSHKFGASFLHRFVTTYSL